MAGSSKRALYEGAIGSRQLQDDTRRAVHWACGMASGERVVDVGCADGLSSLLLAREGWTVWGIDRDPDAVARARARLADEEELVQQRVRFLVGDAHSLPCDDGSCDAALVGDLLRQLVDPEGALAEVKRVLRRGGRIICAARYLGTVDEAEPEPMSLGEMLALLVPKFRVETVEFLGDYVGIAAASDSVGEGTASDVLAQALEVAERRTARAVRELEEAAATLPSPETSSPEQRDALVDELRRRIGALEARVREVAGENDDHRRALLAERSKVVRLEVQVAAATDEQTNLRKAVAKSRGDAASADERAALAGQALDDLRARAGQLEERNSQLAQELASSRTELDGARRRIDDLETTKREALQQSATVAAELRGRIAELEQRAERMDDELARSRKRLEHASRRLGELRSASLDSARRIRDLDRDAVTAQRRAADLQRVLAQANRAHNRERDSLQKVVASRERELAGVNDELVAARAELTSMSTQHQLALDREQAQSRALQERMEELGNLQESLQRQAADVAYLQRRLDRQEPQIAALAAIRSSRSYRLMRALWRANSAVRRPFRRSRGVNPDESVGSLPAEQLVPKTLPPALPASDSPSAPTARENATQRTAGTPATGEAAASRPLTTRQRYEALDLDADRRRFLCGSLEKTPRQRPSRVSDLRVAGIVGTHVARGLNQVCELVTFRPDNWRHILAASPPHLLLVESTYVGNSRSWQYRVAETIHADAGGLEELLAACRASGAVTAFWATRDGSQLGPFVRAMRKFDHVFTADPASVDLVQRMVGEETPVIVVPLAGGRADPPPRPRTGVVYLEDDEQFSILTEAASFLPLLDAALPHGLKIFGPPAYLAEVLPDRFRTSVHTPPTVTEVMAHFSSAKVVIVGGGATGVTPGVLLDAAACGTAVVTRPDFPVPTDLRDAVLRLPLNASGAAQLDAVLADDRRCDSIGSRARAAVSSRHTYRLRLASIASAVGIDLAADA